MTVKLQASRDTTLVEDRDGLYASGGSDGIFVGATARQGLRRGLIAFDAAAALPAGARVTEVTLTLNMNRTRGPEHVIALHRVPSSWGEGTAAGAGGQGGGGIAEEGDAAWVHRDFETVAWDSPGGDFAPEPSASLPVAGPASYTWGSTGQMVADVQGWLDDPSTAHGWILVGDETDLKNAKRFDSRESESEADRPVLTVVYVPAS